MRTFMSVSRFKCLWKITSHQMIADNNSIKILLQAALMRKSLPIMAEFAFLSACQTATGDTALEDEVVHLAAGMLSVGYRSVVGTMWAIGDSDAPVVADAFYGRVMEDATRAQTSKAYALHDAVAGTSAREGG